MLAAVYELRHFPIGANGEAVTSAIASPILSRRPA
jgi:hypothetical protein